MKCITLNISGGLLLLAIILLILNSREQLTETVASLGQSPIQTPMPTKVISLFQSPISTPMPTSMKENFLGGPIATFTPMACVQKDQWSMYASDKAGFSFKYPPTANLRDNSDDTTLKTIYLGIQPHCYDQRCPSGSTIEFRVLTNSRQLPIQRFVQEDLLAQVLTDQKASLPIDIFKNGGRYITVSGVQAIQIDDGTGQDPAVELLAGRFKPVVFVPHGKQVIEIRVRSGRGMVPPFDPPCNGILQMLEDILSTFQLLPLQ